MSPKDWCVYGTGAHARPNPTSNYVDFAVENPRKLKEKPHKKLASIGRGYYRYREKSRQ